MYPRRRAGCSSELKWASNLIPKNCESFFVDPQHTFGPRSKVDFIDESEVLTPADDDFHINKHDFKAPFVCGCTDLGEALRRIGEGAAMIRTKGEAGTGNIVEGVRHLRTVGNTIKRLTTLDESQLMTEAKNMGAPFDLIQLIAREGTLPVPNFAAGGIATPADAAVCMHLGAEAVFVGSGIFISEDPFQRAKSIVEAVTYWQDPKKLAEISTGLGEAMRGLELTELSADQRLSQRGW